MATLFDNTKIADNRPVDEFMAKGQSLKNRWVNLHAGWAYFPDREIQVGVSPKAGSSTWWHIIADEDYYRPRKRSFGDKYSIFIVRNPFDRFISLWKNKCRDGHRICRGEHGGRINGLSIDELLDLIEAGYWNHHWGLQSEMEGGVSDEVVPLKNLAAFCQKYRFKEPEHLNSTSGTVELTPRQRERVASYYLEDIILYDRSLDSSRN